MVVKVLPLRRAVQCSAEDSPESELMLLVPCTTTAEASRPAHANLENILKVES